MLKLQKMYEIEKCADSRWIKISADNFYIIFQLMCWKILKLCKKDAENTQD